MVLTSMAFAQTTGAAAPAAEELTEVVVTGSHVLMNGNDSPTPVTVVSVADMEVVRPGTIADQLNDMPQFSGSRSQFSNPQVGNNNNGRPNEQANVLNLRNFGFTRTLILADGHRVAPTSPDGTVDIDMIPQLLLQRVDIVTGGASAVYGSDAMTGVVNFITDTKFKGLKVNGQAGRSVYNDDPSRAIGVAWGTDLLAGRGHFEASYEFRSDDGVDRRSERPFFAIRPVTEIISSAASGGLTTTTYQLFNNVTQNDRAFGGLILSTAGQPANPLANQYFASNGVLAPFDRGVVINNTTFSVGGSGSWFDTSLKAALKMHQIFGRFDYDFNDSVHGYAKVAGTTNYNNQYSLTQPFYNSGNGTNIFNLFSTNPYLPAGARTTLLNANVQRFGFNKVQSDVPRQFAETFERQYSVDVGLSGKFGNGYRWELAFVNASNNQKVRQNNAEDGLRLAASLDAVTNSGGQIVCNVTITNPTLYPGCVPYNPFGPSTATADFVAWAFRPIQLIAETKMSDVEAVVAGAPFNSWAGPVNMAFSAQWRKTSYRLDSTSTIFNASNPLDCTGLRLLTCAPATSQQWFQASTASSPEVSTNVREAALEFDMPLLKDKFLASDVSLNGGFRYTNYSTSGSVRTWKAGLNWKFNDSLNFRGTRSRDIRAPALFELFQPLTVGVANGTDNLTGAVLNGTTPASDGKTYPSASTFSQGNPKLTPEIGDTTTLGLVYRPGWAPNLSMSLDAYLINVKDAIINLNGNNAASQSACTNSGGASPVCALIIRPNCCSTAPANSATAFYQSYVNIANQWTQGADLEVNYAGHWREKAYNLRFLTAYQPHNVLNNPVVGRTENAGFFGSAPTLRASLIASMSVTDNFKVAVLERWRHSMTWVPRQSAPQASLVVAMPDISPVFYTNLNLSYSLKHASWGESEIYANVANLFDREPPISASIASTQPGIFGVVLGDDVIGRYYTLGFRYKL
jgi:outer membrane receptor protein involved in Fe transport